MDIYMYLKNMECLWLLKSDHGNILAQQEMAYEAFFKRALEEKDCEKE